MSVVLETPSEAQRDEAPRLLSANIALITPFLALLIVTVKLYSISRFSNTTTLTLLSSSDRTTVTFGILALTIAPLSATLLYVISVLYSNEKVIGIELWFVVGFMVILLLIMLTTNPVLTAIVNLWNAGVYAIARGSRLRLWRTFQRWQEHFKREMTENREGLARHRQRVRELDDVITEYSNQEANLRNIADRLLEGERKNRFIGQLDEIEEKTSELRQLRGQSEEIENAYINVMGALVKHDFEVLAERELQRRRDRRFQARMAKIHLVGVLIASIFIFPLIVNSAPWLPPERIVTSTTGTIVGFVVREEDEALLVLRNEDRKTIRVPKSSVMGRDYCQLSTSRSWTEKTIPQLLQRGEEPVYTVC